MAFSGKGTGSSGEMTQMKSHFSDNARDIDMMANSMKL